MHKGVKLSAWHIVDAQKMLMLTKKRNLAKDGQECSLCSVTASSLPAPGTALRGENESGQPRAAGRACSGLHDTLGWAPRAKWPMFRVCPAPAPASRGIPAGTLPGLACLPPSAEAGPLPSHIQMGRSCQRPEQNSLSLLDTPTPACHWRPGQVLHADP